MIQRLRTKCRTSVRQAAGLPTAGLLDSFIFLRPPYLISDGRGRLKLSATQPSRYTTKRPPPSSIPPPHLGDGWEGLELSAIAVYDDADLKLVPGHLALLSACLWACLPLAGPIRCHLALRSAACLLVCLGADLALEAGRRADARRVQELTHREGQPAALEVVVGGDGLDSSVHLNEVWQQRCGKV